MIRVETLTGPAFAAPYLVNGDASGLSDIDRARVNAWLDREGVESVFSIEDDSERFTWSGLLYYPEGESQGLTVCDYVVTLKAESTS